jgi:hypothetical protein
MKPTNANHMFRAPADLTRRAIFERLARWQHNELPAIQNLQTQNRKDQSCKSN